ncbi:MAG: hypothetical protein ABI812_08030, partial [Betaproteobacteria bacterium]
MSADTLSELLRTVRLRGAIYFYVNGVSPWVAETPPACEIADAILPGAEHMIEYHAIAQRSSADFSAATRGHSTRCS